MFDIIFFSYFITGFLLGIGIGYYWCIKASPAILKKGLNKEYEQFVKKITAETERQRLLQETYTKQYQKAIQQAIYDFQFETAVAPERDKMH